MTKREEFILYVISKLEEKSWTKRRLASEAGISSALVHKVLSPKNLREGHIPISQKFCLRVADALSEPPEKLLALAGHLPGGEEKVNELANLANNLDEDRFRMIISFGKFLLEEQRIEQRKKIKPEDRRQRTIPDVE